MKDKNKEAFLALVSAGLWEKEVQISPFNIINYDEIYRLTQEQSVIGLVAAGFEHVTDVNPPKKVLLSFIGGTLQLEQRNSAMNHFVGDLVDKMRHAGIFTLLVKGQGIAQCYERPLWRACGDVDFFLSKTNYNHAKDILIPLASRVDIENPIILHQGMTIESWEVELHGTLCSRLWKSVNNGINEAQDSVLYDGKIRSWMNGTTQVFLPAPDEDVVFVFSHILQHFYNEGIGLRQICDWCRLLWTYRDTINHQLLASRIRKMGIMTEWKAFAALAVDFLGMKAEAMPLYSPNGRWSSKADKVMRFVLETGNFGHNRDLSYYSNKPYLVRKAISLKRHMSDLSKQFIIFPLDTIKAWNRMVVAGIVGVIKGR